MNIPSIFLYSSIALLSFFFLHYILFSYQIVLISLLFIYIFLKKKDHLIQLFLFFILCYFWHSAQINILLKNNHLIQETRKITGIIVDKREINKMYSYVLQTFYAKDKTKNKKILETKIKLITKKNFQIGDYIECFSFHLLKKYTNKEELIKNNFNFGYAGTIITNNIKRYFANNEYNFIYKLTRKLYSLKEIITKKIEIHLKEEYHLYETIFLGKANKNLILEKIFTKWGILHYLARSGMHIQIIITFLSAILLFLGISHQINIYLQLFFLFFFYCFSFQSISFFRSFMMFILYNICQLLKIPTTQLHTLSITLILVLFLYPFSFALLGTQLTFFTTCVLAFIQYKKKLILPR